MSNNKEAQVFDVTIIGAGPTGLFGAFYAGLREMSVKVIDVLPQPGGQLTTLYPEKLIYDSPGFPAIRAKELVSCLVKQTERWKPDMALGEKALRLLRETHPDGDPGDECWVIETDKSRHYTHTVIIAAGIGAFRPIKLKNESVEQFHGKGVEYLVKELDGYAGKRVLVVGGGDSAVDWGLALEPIAEHVTLIHRRDGFRSHDSSLNALMASSIDVYVFYELRELQGKSKLERAVIFDNRTQEETTLEVDHVIPALGFKADLGPIREWGVETIHRRYIRVNNQMETNLPGVYAAGDVALQEGLDPLKLIVVGYGQATIAVNYAYPTIKPGGKVFPGHSTSKISEKA